MEIGISGRNATLVRRQERYCKSCQALTLHCTFEELDIVFHVCLLCVTRYMSNLESVELMPLIETLFHR